MPSTAVEVVEEPAEGDAEVGPPRRTWGPDLQPGMKAIRAFHLKRCVSCAITPGEDKVIACVEECAAAGVNNCTSTLHTLLVAMWTYEGRVPPCLVDGELHGAYWECPPISTLPFRPTIVTQLTLV